MSGRKKTTKAKKTEAEAAPIQESATETPKEEKVMLVTEVVMTEGEQPLPKETSTDLPQTSPFQQPSPQIPTEPEGPTTGETEEEAVEDTHIPEEKEKSMVEDLYKSDSQPMGPELAVDKSSQTFPLATWVVVVLAVVFLVGGGLIVFLRGPVRLSSFMAKPTPTPTPAPTPTPTPTVTIARSEITVQILNGGGVAGAASKLKKLLEEKGYKVSGTGNAQAYSYDKTEISVKSGKDAVLTLLQEDLKDSYTIGKTSTDLSDSVSYDARVIVGKE